MPSDVVSVVEAGYREPQELIAGATGGRRLTAGPRLAEDLEVVTRDFASFYSLGFPPAEGGAGETRRLSVEVKRPGVVVRHRESYRRTTPDEVASQATVAALLYGTVGNPLEVTLERGEIQPRDDGSSLLPLTVAVPMAHLSLLPEHETQAGQLAFFVTTQGAGGETRPVQKIPFHARIPSEQLEAARGRSLAYTLPLVVRPGDRQVAVGVRDDVGGTLATLRLELPTLAPPPGSP